MKKLGYVAAALGAIAIALPSMASAETVIIKRGGHHYHDYGRARAEYRVPRAEYRVHRDYGMHRGWRHHDRDRVVIRERSRY